MMRLRRRKRSRSWKLVLLLLLFGALLLFPNPASAQLKQVRRILIVNVLGPLSSPGVARMDEAIVAGLGKSPYQIELYTEDMEATLFPDESSQKKFREWYIRKYRDRQPDLIIAVGLEPLQFMVGAHEEFFPGVPIVFCGLTEEMLDKLTLDSHFTGVWSVAQPEETLKAALALQPGTKHVVVVGGVGAYDRHLEAIARNSFRKYESELDFTYLTDLGMPALIERLKHLQDHTIVYHTSVMQDADGTRFIDAQQSVPIVAAAANAPVFIVDDVDLGDGTVGGYLLSFAGIGQTAAQMTVRVLNGEKPQDIPVVKSANAYMFDWRALQHWGLKESNLPPGSVVLNRQPTVWESYKGYIIGGISLILVESLLIFGLVWQRSRAKKAEAELAISYDRLRMAVKAGRLVGWEFDIKGRQNSWFGDLQHMFGIPSDSYSAQIGEFSDRVHPEDRDLVSRAIANAKLSRQPYTAEFRIRRIDGSERWVIAMGKFYYAGDGAPERMLGLAVDITDRKLADQKLSESEARLAGIVGSAMDAIIAVDEERRIVLFNAAAEKMFGCTQGEAVGTVLDRFIPERFRSDLSAQMRRFEPLLAAWERQPYCGRSARTARNFPWKHRSPTSNPTAGNCLRSSFVTSLSGGRPRKR
jgi:PAS domain S-box-containing protein